MDKKLSHRIFFITYGLANLGLILYGILAIVVPDILFETFSLHVYQFPEDATIAIQYLSALFRLLGFFNFIVGSIGLVMLRRYQIDPQRWILYLVTASSLITYLGPITFDNTVGHIGFFEIVEHILFIGMIFSGSMILVAERP
jgi:hypothetical protein